MAASQRAILETRCDIAVADGAQCDEAKVESIETVHRLFVPLFVLKAKASSGVTWATSQYATVHNKPSIR